MENAINIPEMKFPLSSRRFPHARWNTPPKTAAKMDPARLIWAIDKRTIQAPQEFPAGSFYAAVAARPRPTLIKIKALAQQFIAGQASSGAGFVGSEAQLPAPLRLLPQVLLLARSVPGGAGSLRLAVTALFGFSDADGQAGIEAIVNEPAYCSAMGQVWQSYIALRINADFDAGALAWLGTLLRADYVIKQLFVAVGSVDLALDAAIELPSAVFPLPQALSAATAAADEDGPLGNFHSTDQGIGTRILRDGNNTVIEFMLHQPASHYVAESQGRKSITMPMSLLQLGVASSNEIGAHNYAELAALYEVNGLTAPPPAVISRSATLAYGEQKLLHLPAGYYVSNASVNFLGAIDGDLTPGVLVGEELIEVGDSWTKARSFGQEYAILVTFPAPASASRKLLEEQAQQVSVAIECVPSPVALQEWRLKTYDAIFRAYQKQALQAANQHGVGIGRNRVMQSPRQIERIQLRQACLRLLRQRAVEPEESARGKAKTLSDAAFRRFAEHTFAWQAMQVQFYANGGERADDGALIALQVDEDADLTTFLEADLARVRVPVRPEHVLGLLYFLETGERWTASAAGDMADDIIILE